MSTLRKSGSRFLGLLLALVMLLGLLPAMQLTASAYAVPEALWDNTTMTVRVDESVGLRGTVTVTTGAGTATGITAADPLDIYDRTIVDVPVGSTSFTVTATPYSFYTFDKLVVAGYAQITRKDGTIDAVEDVQTTTSENYTYNIPTFVSGDTSDIESVSVEFIVYADFSYDYDSISARTNVVSITGSAVSTGSLAGVSTDGNVVKINAQAFPDDAVIKISGDVLAGRQLYVYNSAKSSTTRKSVHIILDNVGWFKAPSGTNRDNYTNSSQKQKSSAGNSGSFYGNASNAGQYRLSDRTKTYGSHIVLADVDAYVTLTGDSILTNNWTELDGGSVSGAAINVDASASLIFTDASTGSIVCQSGGCSSAIGTAGTIPSGYVEIDGGYVTALSIWGHDSFAGIGNGGHYEQVTNGDPGSRGIIVNGGTVYAMGTHYGLGAHGGNGKDGGVLWPTYVLITGGTVTAETSATSAAAAIGFTNNTLVKNPSSASDSTLEKVNQVRIGRPDKEDNETVVTAINWGFGSGIAGEMTFYSGEVEAFSGQYGAAIGGSASTYIYIDSAYSTEIKTAQMANTATAGSNLTIYGGTIRAVAGAFENKSVETSYFTDAVAARGQDRSYTGRKSINFNFNNPTAWDVSNTTWDSWGAGIGGAMSKNGGYRTKIFGGDVFISSSKYGAGIGGGGGGKVGSYEHAAGSGGMSSGSYEGGTWLGQLSKTDGTKVDMSFTIQTGATGAGIGGGGVKSGSSKNAGSGGDLYISGGVFDIQSGLLGAGIGGGGSYSGNGGSGGDVYINMETDAGMIAGSSKSRSTASNFQFNIKSGQFGAGIGGGGSISGTAGSGAASLKITGGNFGITSGASELVGASNSGTYSTNLSFGAGIGGGGSYSGTAGAGPTLADVSGGFFEIYSSGYGSAIGGGGSYSGIAGGCGTIRITGGTIRAENTDAGFAEEMGLKGLGGGAASKAGVGTSNIGAGTVIITGGNVYTTAGTSINGANPGQHVWTQPNNGGQSYTSESWAGTVPTVASAGNQDMQKENTTSEYYEITGIPSERIGELVTAVRYSFQLENDEEGQITETYSEYGLNDAYVTDADTKSFGDFDGAMAVWVPSSYKLSYDLNGGTGVTNATVKKANGSSVSNITYAVGDSTEYGVGTVTLVFESGSSYEGAGQVKNLIQQDQLMNSIIDDGIYDGKTYTSGDNSDTIYYRSLITHSAVASDCKASGLQYVDSTTKTVAVVFAGWSVTRDTHIYDRHESAKPTFADQVTLSNSDVTVYAVYGYDENANGIADICEESLMLTYNANGGTGAPDTMAGSEGSSKSISSTKPTHADTTYGAKLFLGWTTDSTMLSIIIGQADSSIYSSQLSALYVPGGELSFTSSNTELNYSVTGTSQWTFGTSNATLYAVWANDRNYNNVPDYLEPTASLSYVNAATDVTFSGLPTGGSTYIDGDTAILDSFTGTATKDSKNLIFLGWTTSSTAARKVYSYSESEEVAAITLTEEVTFNSTPSDITVYAVWSTDLNGNGTADIYESHYALTYVDSVPEASKIKAHDQNQRYEPGTTVTTLISLDPKTPTSKSDNYMFLGWTTVEGYGTTYDSAETYTATVEATLVTSVTFTNNDIKLYAMWALDRNGNNTPDWLDTYDVSIQYESNNHKLAGTTVAVESEVDESTMPGKKLESGLYGAELITTERDENGNTVMYSDNMTVTLSDAIPETTDNDYVFLGWTPLWWRTQVYGGTTDDLKNYLTHIALITDVKNGTQYSDQNRQGVVGTSTSGSMFASEESAKRSFYTVVNEDEITGKTVNQLMESYTPNASGSQPGLLATVTTPAIDFGSAGTAGSASPSDDYDRTQWTVYAVWGLDENHDGKADMFQSNWKLTYEGNAGTAGTTDNVPAQTSGHLTGSVVSLENGQNVSVTYDDGKTGTLYQAIELESNSDTKYVFLGWTADSGAKGKTYGRGATLPKLVQSVNFGDGNITVYAVWGDDTDGNGKADVYEDLYTLHYNQNGGSGTAPASLTKERGTTLVLATGSGLTKAGSVFMYWTTDTGIQDTYAGDYSGTLPTEVTEVTLEDKDVTVYAVWGIDNDGNGKADVLEKKTFTLTYDGNPGPATVGSVPTDSTAYKTGDTATLQSGSSMTNSHGYIFVGWTLAENDNTVAGSAYDNPFTYNEQSKLPTLVTSVEFTTSNIEVNAVWSTDHDGDGKADVYQTAYKVTYNAGGGVGTMTDDTWYLSGQTVTIQANTFTRTGYTFTGWKADGGTSYSAGATFAITKDTVLTAQWTQSGGSGGGGGGGSTTAEQYTLTFVTNGGSAVSPITRDKGSVISLTQTTTRSDYTFDGWYSDAALTKKVTSVTLDSDMTVYAKWTENEDGEIDWNKSEHFAYIVGYEDGKVRPNNNISRGEVATIFFRLLTDKSRDYYYSTKNSFTDMDGDEWFNAAVSTMANAGFISGRTDGTFGGNDEITRAEFAVIAVRANGGDGNYTGDDKFSDISGSWAAGYINQAVEMGLITGYTDGTFRPNSTITRAEAITLVNRFLGRDKVDESSLISGITTWPDNTEGSWYYYEILEASNSHEFTRRADNAETWTKINESRDWAALQEKWSLTARNAS